MFSSARALFGCSPSPPSDFHLLRRLMTIESNAKCADCGNASAANVNLAFGTFICANCSIVHRELGYTVKSAPADAFTSDELEFLQSVTNAKVNQLWLANWTDGDCKIDPLSDRESRRHFLDLKYRRKRWHREAALPSAPAAPPCAFQPQQMQPCAFIQPQQMQVEQSFIPDFSSDQTPLGSPLPYYQQSPMGEMYFDDRVLAPPQQIGEMPPQMSWQCQQPVQRRKQAVWSTQGIAAQSAMANKPAGSRQRK